MSEFEKFIAELDFQDIAHDTESIRQLYWRAWQAATAESDKRIAELEDEINDLKKEQDLLNKWLDSNRVWFDNSNKEIAELKAHINVLREALKENEFPYSANLDIYNSVRFSDGSHGTMIMESKIVKWLCRNRAKDYFDEMVKGK